MNEFDNVTVKNNTEITGITTINHAKRVQMNLTIAEYTVADLIDYGNSTRKLLTYDYIWRKIGLDKENFLSIAKSLILKGYVNSQDGIKVTRKWMDVFMIGDEWFDAFWFVRGEAYWPGAKKDAREKFIKVCKFYKPEFVIQCRDNYIRFMNHPDNGFRKVMGASVFLNLQTERFKEDWLGHLHRLKHPMEFLPKVARVDFDKQKVTELFT